MEFSDIMKIIKSSSLSQKYGNAALMLWALQIKFLIEDIDSFAADYLTDSPNDKGCDLLWVNRDEKFAVIAQDYEKQQWSGANSAKEKASSLNQAIAWLLGDENINSLPVMLQSGAQELRDAIDNNEIETIYLYYFHNCPESVNIEKELRQVAGTMKRFLDQKGINIVVKEIGQNTIIDWYESVENPILVTEGFTMSHITGYEIIETNWKAISCSINAAWLYDVFQKHKDRLFSANQRGYLGSKRSDRNINNGIKISAKDNPENFWAYNNGLSIIVNSYSYSPQTQDLQINGMSIINGAQTTGAIGGLPNTPSENIRIQARFIQCSDMKIVQDIVRFNNIQNKMLPSDFRSNDTVQKRLVEEFSELDINLNYSGARRGGASDIIGRDPNLISSDTVAQSLMAFHGQPDIAYRYKGRIWEENSNYSKVFNDQTTALHIIFVYSLHTAINEIFHNLKSIERQNMTNTQEDQFEFFTKRGSVYILIFAIGQCIETLLGGKVTNKFRLKFLETRGLEEYKEMWKEVIPVILSFSSKLSESVQKYSFTMEDVNKSVNTINQSLDALLNLNKENFKSIYNSFSSKVVR